MDCTPSLSLLFFGNIKNVMLAYKNTRKKQKTKKKTEKNERKPRNVLNKFLFNKFEIIFHEN